MKKNQQTYISPVINVMFLDNQDILTSSSDIITDGLTARLNGGNSERMTWVG